MMTKFLRVGPQGSPGVGLPGPQGDLGPRGMPGEIGPLGMRGKQGKTTPIFIQG